MSANMNGALHLSIYDGWTVEGTFDGINGYTVEYEGLDDDMPWEERHWKDHECVMNIIEKLLYLHQLNSLLICQRTQGHKSWFM